MAREEAEGRIKWKNAQMNLYGNLEGITPDTVSVFRCSEHSH
jgi:hypothetical protein